ncbi:hypothetical protein PG996_003358 [Apiospora saccharicola]|uniref:Uncharacterized protein n=1 Tax=Apiospora saccharicola TaxID=335842 RepID=A0ABR1W128_9PEZI
MLASRPSLGRSLPLSFALLCLCFLFLFYRHHHDQHIVDFDSQTITTNPAGDTNAVQVAAEPLPSSINQQDEKPLGKPPPEVEIVGASLKSDDTSWFQRRLPREWSKRIYVVDDSHASLTVPKNKGREAMVYLTHIVNNYDTLADTTIFFHAARFTWHNDDPDYDALPTLKDLRFEYVRQAGYVNLRCVWVIGCPDEIHPHQDTEEASRLEAEWAAAAAGGGMAAAERPPTTTKAIYKQAFEELLPGVPVPDVVAVSCCSQFAVTREAIRRRPREDYVRFRDWLLNTPLTDDLSGRVMEFAWHIIFGKARVHCPSAQACYCNLWGLCGNSMSCTEGECEGRYTLPKLAMLPDQWPVLGWQGEDRNFTGPLD